MTVAQLQTALAAAIEAGNTIAAQILNDALNDLAQINANPSGYPSPLATDANATKQALQNLTNSSGNPAPNPSPNAPSFPSNGEITKDVRTGVDQAMTDQSGGVVPPSALTPEANPGPDAETPIPGILDTFWTSIHNLPVVSLLTGISFTASGGSPSVVFTLPKYFVDGSRTVSYKHPYTE